MAIEQNITVWRVHAGQQGQADALFLKHNVAALGWAGIGNLGLIDPSREAFKEAYALMERRVRELSAD